MFFKKKNKSYFEQIIEIENLKKAFLDLQENFFNPMNNTYELGKLARGIDGESFAIFQKGFKRKLKQIKEELETFKNPLPSIDLKIPKNTNPNKFRTISISSLREKIKHQAVCRIIEPKLDEIFQDNLYSYRENMGAYQAIKAFRKVILFDPDPYFIYKVDMQNYFDNLDHEILLELVRKTFNDSALTKLIQVFVKQRRLSPDGLMDSDKGVVQGIAISAHMANLYLADLDKEMADRGLHYFRVGDDIIVLHKNRDELVKISQYIEHFLTEKKKLLINREKTKIYDPDEAFEYLGYEIRNKNFRIAKRNCEKMKGKIRVKLNKKLTEHINRKRVNDEQLLQEILSLVFHQKRLPDHVMWLRYFLLTNDVSQIKAMDDFIENRIRLVFFGKKRNKNYNILPLSKMRKFGYVSLAEIYFDIVNGRKYFTDYVRKLVKK